MARDAGNRKMAHEIAKLMLEHAGSFIERTEAVESAVYLGMPLAEIEEYLDWLDLLKSHPDEKPGGGDSVQGPQRKDVKPRQSGRGAF